MTSPEEHITLKKHAIAPGNTVTVINKCKQELMPIRAVHLQIFYHRLIDHK